MTSTQIVYKSENCNCLAVRQAARHLTQFYDRFLSPAGLRTTQYSILGRLKRAGPMTIHALAAQLVMDRTTLGRNILPLQREGLIAVRLGKTDRRSKELHLTEKGRDRYETAFKCWIKAQNQFDTAFGDRRAAELRNLLHAVAATELGPAEAKC